MVKTDEQKIMLVLREAIELADIGGNRVSNRAICERVYNSEPELMAEYQKQWSIDRMLWMVARERRERIITADSPDVISIQPTLPGFESLPQTIFLRNGRRQRLDYASAVQISEHIAMLKARMDRSPKIGKFQAVLKVMRKYTEEQPDITWADVKRKELAKPKE